MKKNMNYEDIFKCIADALNVNINKINIDSHMLEFEEWDSFGHLGILVALDKKFKGKVASISEMASANSIAKIIELLKHHKLI